MKESEGSVANARAEIEHAPLHSEPELRLLLARIATVCLRLMIKDGLPWTRCVWQGSCLKVVTMPRHMLIDA